MADLFTESMRDPKFRRLYRWESFKDWLGRVWAWLRDEPYCHPLDDAGAYEWRRWRTKKPCSPKGR